MAGWRGFSRHLRRPRRSFTVSVIAGKGVPRLVELNAFNGRRA
jgi:hypothetical protein